MRYKDSTDVLPLVRYFRQLSLELTTNGKRSFLDEEKVSRSGLAVRDRFRMAGSLCMGNEVSDAVADLHPFHSAGSR